MNRHAAVILGSLSLAVFALPASPGAQARGTQARGTQAAPSKPLTIYVVDTEGGKATLFITPTGQSLLMDSGNPGGRDTDRIMAVLADAGLTSLDYLLTTHYHVDHIGRRMPSCTGRRSTWSSNLASACRSPASTGES
jgi:beta-lactamase superfamily II metal-dependent hydrolase